MSSHTPICFSLVLLTNVLSLAAAFNYVSNYTEVASTFERRNPTFLFQNPDLQIQLPNGLIQGSVKRTVDVGMPYYSFEGVPYAKPPVGGLRFQVFPSPEKTICNSYISAASTPG
jgi:hypothetical protein